MDRPFLEGGISAFYHDFSYLDAIQRIPSNASHRHGPLVYALVRELTPQVIVEIGQDHGYLTAWMALGLLHNYEDDYKHRGLLFSVDNDPECPRKELRNTGLLGHWITHVDADSHDPRTWERLLPDNIDLACIDGDHSYAGVKADAEFVRPRLTEFGAIVFHDSWPVLGVNHFLLNDLAAWGEVCEEAQWTEFWADCGLWLWRKVPSHLRPAPHIHLNDPCR